MDITKSTNKIFTTKYINGETINYCTVYFASVMLFLVSKQIFKTIFGIGADISIIIAFAIGMIVLYFLEKKFVFNHKVHNETFKQIILYIFRVAIDFGFFKICEFVFVTILKRGTPLAYFFAVLAFCFFNYYFDKLIVFDSTSVAKNNANGKCYKIFFSNRFIVVSVLLALVGILFIYMIFSLFPFGDMTVLRMDLYHQYGPLFAELYDRVVEHKSFLYSWESGGGSSFLGNYFNYLSSPLSVIIFLFDRKQISYAITTLVLLKGILCSATFTYYLKKSLNAHSYASASFGIFYAFCGYFLAYYWNIMWIDGMILLPLIALGIENIINKGKSATYIISLTLLLFSSYYMGYMACIFSVLYFIVYFFISHSATDKIDSTLVFTKKYSLKKLSNIAFLNRGVNFAVSSIICGLLCACTLIPVYFILQACSATSDSFPHTFESYFNILDMISSHMAGLETTIRSSGDDVLPNIYSGVLTILLVPLYIANKDIRIKEKALYIITLLFFVFSFDNNVMNFIWHALHFPNDLPYRFSFMYTFILLVIAFKGLMHIKSLRYQDIAMVGMFWIFIVLIFQKFPTNKISEFSIYITLAFIIIWTGVLLMIKKGKMTNFVVGITIIAITFCEVIVADSNSYLFTQKQEDYVSNYDSYEDAIDYTYLNDDDFYRTELCYLDTRMDPSLYGYNGMSVFSSMAYEDYSQTQYSLGMFGNRINSYTYNTQTPVYNMMYAIKYLMQTDESITPSSQYYSQYYTTQDEKTTVYKNDYFLPIAFETSSDIKDWDNSEGNPFSVQEDFIDKATGVSNVFEAVKYISTVCENADCEEVTENGMYSFSLDDSDSGYGSIDVTIEAVRDGNLYVYITSPEIENINYYWNDSQDTKYQGISEPYIMDLGYHNAGEQITISFDVGSIDATSSYFDIYAYNINNDVLDSAYEMLNTGGLEITSYSDTKIEGTINAGYDGFLYTSIPYDEGWSIYIDGEKVKTFDIGDCQLATTIKQGEHTITMKYTPKGQKAGLIITATGWLCLAGYALKKKKSKKLVER